VVKLLEGFPEVLSNNVGSLVQLDVVITKYESSTCIPAATLFKSPVSVHCSWKSLIISSTEKRNLLVTLREIADYVRRLCGVSGIACETAYLRSLYKLPLS